MIIDYKANPSHAVQFSVFDAETGQKLDHELSIFYADDQAGLLKVYKRLMRGVYFNDPATGLPVVEEIRRKIDIVRKA